ncbi:MAG TPA: FkbM family methyltransferase [Nitrospiraceae bacterium]|nr:FkbM family methyltransferase [Nitrospiraceae bacterium]
MSLKQFANSINRILTNHHINRGHGILKHLQWQGRKMFNLFPFEQRISGSGIIASHRQCAVSALINSQGLYDYNNMKLIQELLRGGGTFVDIGANIGSYALIASENSSARVFAFEPHPITFQLLQKNIALNQRSNVSLHNVALGSSEGTVFLTDRRGSSINHIVPGSQQMPGTVAVPCHRMDHLCQITDIRPQIVKIDVEGFEYDVLLGFGHFISSVQVLMIEMNGLSDERSHGQQEIHSLLLSKGFSGPWTCRFDQRQMLPAPDGISEDSLYVSSIFYHDYSRKGFTFVDDSCAVSLTHS